MNAARVIYVCPKCEFFTSNSAAKRCTRHTGTWQALPELVPTAVVPDLHNTDGGAEVVAASYLKTLEEGDDSWHQWAGDLAARLDPHAHEDGVDSQDIITAALETVLARRRFKVPLVKVSEGLVSGADHAALIGAADRLARTGFREEAKAVELARRVVLKAGLPSGDSKPGDTAAHADLETWLARALWEFHRQDLPGEGNGMEPPWPDRFSGQCSRYYAQASRILGTLGLPPSEEPHERTGGADWTVDPETGRSNSSPAFLAIVDAVSRLIGDPAGANSQMVVAQLAHVHGLAPRRRKA